MGSLAPGGVLVTCADDAGAASWPPVPARTGVPVMTYGESEDADLRIREITSAVLLPRRRWSGPSNVAVSASRASRSWR